MAQDGKGQSRGRETKPSWRKCNPSAQAWEREVQWTDEATKPHIDQEVVEDHVLFMQAENSTFFQFDEVVQLMVENGDDEVRKHLDTTPRNANYGSYVAIIKYLMPLACGSNRVFSDLLKKLHSIQYWLMSRQIATIEELSICFRWVDSSGHQWNISWNLLAFLLVMQLQYLLRWKLF